MSFKIYLKLNVTLRFSRNVRMISGFIVVRGIISINALADLFAGKSGISWL